MGRIFVTRRLYGDALDALDDVDVWDGDRPPAPETLRARAAGSEGLLCLLTDRVDAALLDACPQLKVIANYAVGTDNVDLAACAERGISVGRTPDVLTDATADLTVALLLAVARKLPQAATAVREGAWHTWEPRGWLGSGLRDKRLLIVGPGRIGRAVGARAEGFGMEVGYAGRDDDLDAAVAQADVVSLHAPLTDATRGLVDPRAMKRGAILVNTARGPLVDPAALRDALQSGHLAGAGLDVTDPEPLPADDPLLGAPNLLVLPHVGSATREARAAMTRMCAENLQAGLAGQPLPYPAE